MSTQHQAELWAKLINSTSHQGILRMAMQHVGYTLADMVGQPFKIDSLHIETHPINQLTTQIGNPEKEVVGIYLLTSDDLPGQAILMLSLDDAMYLSDWLLEERPGTTTSLNALERSALAETGNQILSAFLNAVAEFSDTMLRPSPPAVMVDMLAAVLEVVVTPVAAVSDELLIIKTNFVNTESSLLLQFWVLPDPTVIATNWARNQ
jgi:chemotaxis protein CheC